LRHAFALLVALWMAVLGPAPAADKLNPADGNAERTLVGLPVYSSDGKPVGRILALGVDDGNRPVLVAEIDRPLGIGADAVAIPFDMFVRKPDRVELTITAQEVAKRTSRAARQR
jgi:PRC-barrel domain